MGVVGPNGIGLQAFWDSILTNRSGIKPISLFATAGHPCDIAGEIQDFSESTHLPGQRHTDRLSRQARFALAAVLQAYQHSGYRDVAPSGMHDIPLFMGVSSSAIEVIVRAYDRLSTSGPDKFPHHWVSASQPQQAASEIAYRLPFTPRTQTIASACASGLEAVAAGVEILRSGRADFAIVGAADAPINAVTFASMAGAGLVRRSAFPPGEACRPFDRDHSAGAVSEGAAALTLETLESARARGAAIFGEILGYHANMDEEITRPGRGLTGTMQGALDNSHLLPRDIDYVNAHAPGHYLLDVQESQAIQEVLGAHAYHIPVTSIKGITGSPLAAAGPMQIIACCLAMAYDLIPPTANHHQPAEGCDLDYAPRQARRLRVSRILINSHGLGNGNISMVLERIAA
jgi:3-oxoacyl-(acyl-carrier-protein) synthase